MRKQAGEVNGPGHTASQWQSWILTLVCAVHPEPVTLTTKMYMEGMKHSWLSTQSEKVGPMERGAWIC